MAANSAMGLFHAPNERTKWQGTTKERKRRAVAFGALAGHGTQITASQAGCSERHARRLAAEPETQFIVTEAMRPYHAKLHRLIGKVITAIEEALSANKTDAADHISRLRAVERYREVAELAQGKLPEKSADDNAMPQYTWEEFVALYATRIQTEDEIAADKAFG
jgi:hypothetical protein